MDNAKYYSDIIKKVLDNYNIKVKDELDDPIKNVTFNYTENGDAIIEVLLPGARKEDINITVQNINNNDFIVIEAKYNRLNSFKQLQSNQQLYNIKSSRIPILIEKSKYNIEEPKTVTYVDGVLTIVLRGNIEKEKEKEPKKITIN